MKRQHAIQRRLQDLAVLLATIVSLGLGSLGYAQSCCDDCDCDYSTYSSPKINGGINWCESCGGTPVNEVEVCEGGYAYFWVYTEDKDKDTHDCPRPCPECEDPPTESWIYYDSSAADWTASDGTPSSESYSSGFWWQAPMLGPSECSRTVTITATATDPSSPCPYSGSCHGGNCNDGSGESDSITVIVKKCTCEEPTVAVNAGGFSPEPVCQKCSTSWCYSGIDPCDLLDSGELCDEQNPAPGCIPETQWHTQTASLSASEDAQCECSEEDPTWSWSIVKVQYRANEEDPWQDQYLGCYYALSYVGICHPDPTSSSATIVSAFPTAGYWRVGVQATYSWRNYMCTSYCYETSEIAYTPSTVVVEVDEILVNGFPVGDP